MDKTIPYLLTLSSHTPGIDRFLESTGNAGELEHIPVQFQPWSNKLLVENIANIYCHNFEYPGHIEKFQYVPDILDPERYVVFTDTDDVLFQKELPNFTEDMHIAPENVLHKHTIYQPFLEQHPQYAYLLEKPVFNSGCFAMRVPVFYEYTKHLTKSAQKIPTRLNQVFFNDFVYNSGHSIKADPTVFCPIYANLHQDTLKKIDGKWFYNKELVSCVHGNGWTKEIL